MNDKNKEINDIVGDYKYGFKTDAKVVIDTGKGLSEEVVRKISELKGEPDWMLEFRLKAYHKFVEMSQPNFGPNLDFIDFNDYTYYIKSRTPNTVEKEPARAWNFRVYFSSVSLR